MEADQDWKKSVGFPINYHTESSEDDFDIKDVVMRRPRHSEYLLEDGGDGAEADLLGTTPPRGRIRDKMIKKKSFMDNVGFKDGRRTAEDLVVYEPVATDRPRSRLSLKLQRKKERDFKQDMGLGKADSLPSPNPTAAVPTLVESCSRFMSLSSRLKCRDNEEPVEEEPVVERRMVGRDPDAFPPSRVNFHKTFSMLINMGNIDKGCRRTISREEQVWQNELKDLIWLEIQAKIAGRTLADQDAFLCAQRNVVPVIVQNIRNYRFVSPKPCPARTRKLGVINDTDDPKADDSGTELDADSDWGCVSLNCRQCTEAVGKAMREVGSLLDSVYNAAALYPSWRAMTADHPLVATNLFQNRIKAMCLWYNTALFMRLKMAALRRMVRSMQLKQRSRLVHLQSTDSDVSRQSIDTPRPCMVRFNVSATPSDSSNSDASGNSELKDDDGEGKRQSIVSERDEGHETGSEDKRDEVDSGCDKKNEMSAPTTPEIVISDSKYSTTDTTTSNESGYTSSHSHKEWNYKKLAEHVYELNDLDDLTGLKLLNRCQVSIFRAHHYEILKTQGVRRCMLFMDKMRSVLLHRVRNTLEKYNGAKSPEAEEDAPEVFDDTKEDTDKADAHSDDEQKVYELRRYGCWSEECLSMRLPSYRNHFLLLSSICMEASHDYLSLRLEDRPQNPSCLTIKQLIHELKEGLDIATEMRADFARNIEVALAGHPACEPARQDLLLIVNTYDQTIESVFKQYLSYLRTMSVVEQLGRSVLQSEWRFTARLAKRARVAALLAPATFSEIVCNQLNRLHELFKNKFKQLAEEFEKNAADNDRHKVYGLCRAVQQVYAGERDAALQTAQWARALAARLARAPHKHYLQHRHSIFESLMNVRNLIVVQTNLTLDEWRAHDESLRDGYEAIGARLRELMLQIYRLGFELHKELYSFAQTPFKEAQYIRRPVSLQPTRRIDATTRRKRPETMIVNESFNPMMIHRELHRFVSDSERGPCRKSMVAAVSASASASPPRGAARFMRSDSVIDDVETNVFDDINSFTNGPAQSSIEILLSGAQPPIEDRAELRPVEVGISDEEKQWATRVARAVVEFAKCWMEFVIERCDTGRGLRPRWASQGLEFLMLACDPCNTKHLTEVEFEDLKKKMDGCISHVIGSRPAAPRQLESGSTTPDTHRRRPRLHSPLPSSSSSSTSSGRSIPAPPTPPTEPDPLRSFPGIDSAAHSNRVLEAIKQVDSARDAKLRAARSLGVVVEAEVRSYEPKLRQLSFKWQRGLKIGAGTFGKVYTVVNTESGQLLAMKELHIGAGDRRALRRAANELQLLEGVIHPHLVRYYGCELHREEMLIFMELCVEGSLEALIATSGALAEHMVRRYTKQLLSAVAELHARSIAHRDIKSGNIFLTNEGHCLKLGDFGCAVKIRANTTAAGELIGHVGTQAYMAPEVFMKSTGHGRAADIWSLGCVVTEMASGKRPFAEYDSNVQIMFVVGMGGRPAIPECLSDEGQRFCQECLTHEPEQRPKAEALSLHHFLKLESDEDCNCQPSYLIT